MNITRLKFLRGFTLIEMLIVIAMISILTASTMAIITGPMREQVISGAEAAAEAGAGTFFSKLVPDSHAARELIPLPEGQGLRLAGAGTDGGDVVYFKDTQARLRRALVPASAEISPGAGNVLLDDVVSLESTQIPANGLWKVTLRAGQEKLGRNLAMERSVELGIGPDFYTGGKR